MGDYEISNKSVVNSDDLDIIKCELIKNLLGWWLYNMKMLHILETFIIFATLNKDIMDEPIFELVVLEPARDFLKSLPASVRAKISYNIRKVQAGVRDSELFAKMEDTDGIWEFRTKFQKNAYRLFPFWDTDEKTLVVATNGIIKKTQKTPNKEIAKAEELRRLYFEAKHRKNENDR